jgi:hypothetical protein
LHVAGEDPSIGQAISYAITLCLEASPSFPWLLSQLKRLQTQESELLQRLERLNEAENNAIGLPIATGSPIATRVFVIGDLVQIRNPRSLQSKKGTIIRIGVDTDRVTVLAKKGSKIIRASSNLIHID